MNKPRHSRLLQFTGLLLSALVWLANDSNPPNGKSGAPFDGHCNDCHMGNSNGFDGDVTLSGLPATIQPNGVYPITLTMNVTSGSPAIGGFQIVVVDGSNADVGDLANVNTQTGTEMLGGREYLDHRNGKVIAGGSVSWDFQWTAPATMNGNTIKFYYIGNFCNNNNQNSGDFAKANLETYTFEGPPPVTATITASSNVLCFGGNTGSATVEAGGGIAPYTYHWSNNQNTATATNLVANTYTVTVTGASGSGTATASVVITQPTPLALTASAQGVLSCLQTTVNATATATGGTPSYDYVWSDGQTGNTAGFTTSGTYGVTATDANGCTKVASVTVNQNNTPPTAVVAPGGTLNCVTTQTTLSGAGSSTGGSFQYAWITLGGNIVSGANTLTPLVNGCGTYILTVTNTLNGCTASASTSVACEIDPPNVSLSNNGPLTCNLITATLSGNSTTPNVTYSWTGPNGYVSSEQNPGATAPGTYVLVVKNQTNSCTSSASTVLSQNIVPPTDTANVSGVITCNNDSVQIFLNTNIQHAKYSWTGPNGFTSTQKKDTIAVPGDYIGIVTDTINGCKSRDTITVIQNTTAPGTTAAASGSITCTNTSVQLSGGPSGPFTYAWSGPNNYSSTVQNPTVNSAGTYTLVVNSGANGCTASATVTVQQNNTPPTAAVASAGNLNCNNTTLQLNGSASSQGANFGYMWTTVDGNIVSGENTLTPIVDAAGTYVLVVSNNDSGCTSSASVAVTKSPAVNAFIIGGTSVACYGGASGASTVQGTGGVGNFTYLWSNGGTTQEITGLIAGTYIATVTDGEGCTASVTAVVVQPFAPLQVNATATGETALGANNGTATAAPTGGTPTYSYNWSNGGTTATITGLAPGTYTVTTTDFFGCLAVQTVTVNAFGCSLAASISSTNATCNGADNGTAAVTTTGEANPVVYTWSNGASTQSVSGLEPGSYTVSIVDGNNCPAVLNVSITEPTAVAANASATSETASGANDGTATATPTGGAGSYTYLWSNGLNTATIIGLTPGIYTVSVTDANNCLAVQTVNVGAFNCAISATTSQANVSCFGLADGSATAVLSGGQLPYTYAWSNGATTATASNLAAGTYTVNVIDDAGCATSETVTITQPTALTAQATNIQNVVCATDFTGSVTIVPDGGTAPYTFTGSVGNLGVGAHAVKVTDANGCSTDVSFNIVATDSQPPVVSCPANIFFCGADFVSYPAPTATDNCSLSGNPVLISGQASGTVFNDGTTVQVYRATDASGNSATCSFAVVVYPIPDILIVSAADDHNGLGVGSIDVTPVGGSGSYFFVWNRNGQFFSNSEDLSGLNAGSYTLTITDGNGCTSALAPIVIGNTVGTSEPGAAGSIRLYPNPATTSLQLEIIDLDVIAAFILDTRGRMVYELQPLEWQSEVAVDQLATGVYFLRLATESGRVVTLKFVKSE